MIMEVCECVLDIAFENIEKKERVKRKKKYVKNRSVSKKIKKIGIGKFISSRTEEAMRIFKLATSKFKKMVENT